MSNILNVGLSRLHENPYRQLNTYPWIEGKVKTLMRSIEEMGMWEGIIARRHADDYQIAFGHHRLEAARRLGLKEVPIIVRDLSDQAMIQMMGRENGEDYSTDFLVMLNTWEGALKFGHHDGQKSQAIDCARLLGWTLPRSGNRGNENKMNPVAEACASAHALIEGGYIARDDLRGMSVRSAREIVQRAHSRMEQIEKIAEKTQRPKKEVEAVKKTVAKAAKLTADDVRGGRIAAKDVGHRVDTKSFEVAATSKVKESPLLISFGVSLAKRIASVIKDDHMAEKLLEIEKVLHLIKSEEDLSMLRQVNFSLSELSHRAVAWQKRLIPVSKKVVGIKSLEHKNA